MFPSIKNIITYEEISGPWGAAEGCGVVGEGGGWGLI